MSCNQLQQFVSAVMVFLAASGVSAQATNTVRVTNTDELYKALAGARPGTTVRLAPGKYRSGVSFANLRGDKGKPIVIEAEEADDPPVFGPEGSGIHFTSPAHLEIRNLVIAGSSGNGINIDDGGKAVNSAHHIKLVGLKIRDVGPRGNRDAIKLSGIDDFEVNGCALERWGDGGSAIDMVGCHRGVIENCTFKHSGADGANGVQTKGGSDNVVIRRCRFEDAGGRAVNIGGSTGLQFFRPRLMGYEAKDITVEDCTFIGSAAPIAFVGVDGAVVRNNTIYRPKRWVLRILQESQGPEFVPCRNGKFHSNVIAFRSDEVNTTVNVGGKTNPASFVFSENFWFCIDRSNSTRNLVRLPVQETKGIYGVDPKFQDAEKGELRTQARQAAKAGVRENARDDAR